jgi:hypothetical protein
VSPDELFAAIVAGNVSSELQLTRFDNSIISICPVQIELVLWNIIMEIQCNNCQSLWTDELFAAIVKCQR